jgi:hypothetical protein
MAARRSTSSHVLIGAIALGLVAAPSTAASLRAEASAVIKSGIAVRASGTAEPLIQMASTSPTPIVRTVLRPCRPNEPLSTAQCRIHLLEVQ